MPTPTKGPRLGGGPAHERLILANLATALFEHDRITTTQAKAKRLRPLAERLVTFAKRGDLHARRRVLRCQRQGRRAPPVHRDRARRGRASGWLHAHHQDRPRKGDNAPMAVIELVREPLSAKQATVKEAEARDQARGQGAPRRPSGRARPPCGPPAAPSTSCPSTTARPSRARPAPLRPGRRCSSLPQGAVAAVEDGAAPAPLLRQGQRRLGPVPRSEGRSGTTRPSPSSGSRPRRPPRPPASSRPVAPRSRTSRAPA